MKPNSGSKPKRRFPKSQALAADVHPDLCSEEPLSSPCQAHDTSCNSLPTWTSLQSFSFARWTSTLCSQVLASCTPFAEFLRRSLHISRSSSVASDRALFPLPLPKEGVFKVSRKVGSRERRKRSFDQAVHVAIMALNLWHADFRFPPLDLVALTPSPSQARVLSNLRDLFKAFGSSSAEFSVPASGRRSTSLVSQLADLCDFVTWDGLAGASYERGFKGTAGGLEALTKVPVDNDKAPELTPYKSLQPDRLKITGSGEWDPSEFLSDPLWLAFCEPESLRWSPKVLSDDVPDLSKERYDDVLQLMKIWDAKGLLFLRDTPLPEHDACLAMRFFNCHKSLEYDRMIGDRRARNYVEGRIPGVSRCLPQAMLLANLEVSPQTEKFSICISDRKDFYHQFRVTPERAASNVLWPPVRESDLRDTKALASWAARNMKPGKYDRALHGDTFGGGRGNELKKKASHFPGTLLGCFASVPQGDHLGVEFAVDSHRNLLKSEGLLAEQEELRSDRLFKGEAVASGLVIDDFYAVSKVHAPLCSSAAVSPPSDAQKQMQKALEVYAREGILGSPEKDVVNADKAKITGGELDSSLAVRQLGLSTLASPVEKRLSLAFVSLHIARLRWTTDQLHLCLLGGWVHSLLYRRAMMSILEDGFRLVDSEQFRADCPRLIHLPRAVAQELVLLSVLVPFMTTDLAAKLSSTIYATDSSDIKGAYVQADVPINVARALRRSGRKKGGYTRMLSRTQALLKKIDPTFEELPVADEDISSFSPERPFALRFHFLEICGGAGKVARALSQRGWTVGPVIDLDKSRFYDLSALRLISWIFHLLERGLLDSFMVEPPCTTFSPAQHPASRGYDCPRGYDPEDPKTLMGTTLALRALSLIKKGSEMRCPGLLEQPRRSKMRRLQEWLFLLEAGLAEEVWTAGCMFGSPHQKEFVFLLCHLEASLLHRKCDGLHKHIRIEGKYTKASAIYPDDLAECLAAVFDRALCKKLRIGAQHDPHVIGLESPLCNDMLVGSKWTVSSVWRWRRPVHINILETRVVQSLLKRLALSDPRIRVVVALDSNVGLSALVKGRSPSYGLRPCVRRIGATVIAGCLYPAYQFAPTRLNPADHPTRDNDMPEPLDSVWTLGFSLRDLLDFAEIQSLSRPAANWVRLVSSVCRGSFAWLGSSESWRYQTYAFKHHPFEKQVSVRSRMSPCRDFDQTLGFPGEGPVFIGSVCLFDCALDFLRQVASLSLDFLCLAWTFVCLAYGFSPGHSCDCRARRRSGVPYIPCRGFVVVWIFVGLLSSVEGVSHGPSLCPRDAGDRKRASARGPMNLPEGRPVLGKTQDYREKLLAAFDSWLKQDGMSLDSLLFSGEPNIELINLQLERYGRSLYQAGRPYGHYSETINGVSGKRPRLKRMLAQAWDLAYAWLRQEPPTHHLALPWQALLSLLVTALYWGWVREAGILALSWGGLTRIGEALAALREELVLPRDVEFSADYALLQISEPKTRFRTARHQVAKLDQPQLLALIDLAFGKLKVGQRLWPYSAQTMRGRFQKLLAANKLDLLPRKLARGLDLGSLRAGGASWMMMVSDNVEMIRRRGRCVSMKVMEIYVQEVSAVQFIPNLPMHVKRQVIEGAAIFPWILSQAQILDRIDIPHSVWPIILRDEALKLEQNG